MDSQGQDYSYTQPSQYGYPPQPQQYPQHHPPALQPYAPHPSFPQYPPFNPPQPQQFYPPPFAGPHNLSYTPPSATSAAPPPPFDPELQKRIDKLVEYTAKNGPEFEIMIREKQSNNPDYSFLFGGDGHNYYRYKLLNINFTHPPPPAPSAYHQMIPPPYHQPSYHLRGFVGLRGPLPADVAAELDAALNGLTGTKESIKAAKSWFMQRAPFAPALAEALKDRVFSLDDSERQLHVVFLANDILFESLQNRINPRELDNEARALLPVLGSMLSRVFHNPQNRDENQSRLLKIIQFWSSREVFDQETITSIEREMITGTVPTPFPVPPQNWQHDNTQITPPYSLPTQIPFSGPVPVPVPTQPVIPLPVLTTDPNPPPYPLFPPGLIPGMVRKMQIGSGVPYSPLSPLDIPTLIPPSPIPESQILERVSKFFKEIGETNPSRRQTGKDVPDDEYDGYGRESPVRKGGMCIPPPVSLQVVDPETGMHADGSVPESTGTGRLGLGAVNPDDSSQYDDVYSSYRKHRSTSYHTFMSSRAENR